MRSIISPLLFIVVLAASSQSQFSKVQLPEDTLAIVDDHAITARDLLERIELMPFELKIQERDFESIKRKAVESLVGEYILSQVAEDDQRKGQWQTETMRSVLQKMFVRDAMFKREIRSKVTISEGELQQAVKRYAVRRKVLALHPESETDAKRLLAEWRSRRSKGESGGQILSFLNYRYDTLLVPFGSIDPDLEAAAYALEKNFDAAGPVFSKPYGLLLIVLLADEPNPEASGKSATDRQAAVRDILQEQKENLLVREFTDGILHGQHMTADSAVFPSVTRRLWEIIRSDTVARQVPGGFRYLPEDVYRLMSLFNSQLDTPIVRGSFGVLRLGEFLEGLLHYDFTIPSLRPGSFSVSFFQILRTLTEAEMVAQEGLRRGFQYSADVQRDLGKWTAYWKSRTMEFSVADTVTIKEWEPYLALWRNNPALIENSIELNVQEILRPDSGSAASLLRLIDEGVNMDSLAHLHTARMAWREGDGKSGWFKFHERSELASKTMLMSVGETKGPIKLRDGYAALRLLGRRFSKDSTLVDSLLQRETKRVRMAHQQATINRVVARAALARRIEIYYGRIKAVEVTNINMFTRRIIGFGGRMNAAPLLVPQWQWVEEWKKLRGVMP